MRNRSGEVEVVEQDTGDSEDIPNLLEYILPNGRVPDKCRSFGVGFNKRIFDGWVKQPSACCGAASVAGAWNALLSLHRRDSLSLNHNDVLNVFRQTFQELIERKESAYERKLGACLRPFYDILTAELQVLGRSIGGKKAQGINKKIVLSILKKVCVEDFKNSSSTSEGKDQSALEEDYLNRSPIKCFIELYENDGVDFAALCATPASEGKEGEADSKEDDEVNYVVDSKDKEHDEVMVIFRRPVSFQI